MFKGKLSKNMSLKINHPDHTPSYLPWDLRTIFDCILTLDDVETLEAGTILQIGECFLELVKEETCPNIT